jgi:hypothetical protein
MTVKAEAGITSRSWRSALQRSVDTVSEYADVAAQKLGAMSDPRARLLRKRRWALRLGLFFGFASVFWTLVTGLLASWSTPVWALLITGLIAAGAAVPATLWLLRYRWLRGEPLPPRREVSGRRLPPQGSVARPAMSALGASERGLHSLLAVLDSGNLLPSSEIRELTAAAGHSAAAMAATAAQVASMERAAGEDRDARAYLAPTINALTAQLNSGVRQYNEMVTAAAHVVSSANAGSAMVEQRYRQELVNATDQLLGWAQAFEELGPAPRV